MAKSLFANGFSFDGHELTGHSIDGCTPSLTSSWISQGTIRILFFIKKCIAVHQETEPFCTSKIEIVQFHILTGALTKAVSVLNSPYSCPAHILTLFGSFANPDDFCQQNLSDRFRTSWISIQRGRILNRIGSTNVTRTPRDCTSALATTGNPYNLSATIVRSFSWLRMTTFPVYLLLLANFVLSESATRHAYHFNAGGNKLVGRTTWEATGQLVIDGNTRTHSTSNPHLALDGSVPEGTPVKLFLSEINRPGTQF